MDGPTLDALKVKAAALKTELEGVSNTKTKTTTASEMKIIDAVRKVDDLYEKINRIQAVAADLPALVLRLKTLEAVHQTSAGFSARLNELEALARGASEDMKSNSEVLGNLKQVKDLCTMRAYSLVLAFC
jgi:Dynamitin